MKSNIVIRWLVVFVLILNFPVFSVTDEETQKIREAMPNKLTAKPERQRTMLVFSLCNGYKHSSIPYWIKALDMMSEKTGAFKVVHSTDMSVFTAESLKQFDAICFNNTTKLVPDEAQQKAILDFVKSGKGIVGIHAATDNFYEWPEGMQTSVEVRLGLGKLTLRFPEDLGVRVDIDKLFVGFDKAGFIKRGSYLYSQDYDSASAHVSFEIKAALGEVDIVWVR